MERRAISARRREPYPRLGIVGAALAELRSVADPTRKPGTASIGIDVHRALGVSVPNIRRVAGRIGTNHVRALELVGLRRARGADTAYVPVRAARGHEADVGPRPHYAVDGTQLANSVLPHRHRACPADPLGDHRRRHVRPGAQQFVQPWLHGTVR